MAAEEVEAEVEGLLSIIKANTFFYFIECIWRFRDQGNAQSGGAGTIFTKKLN
jgi:hypothetical protein